MSSPIPSAPPNPADDQRPQMPDADPALEPSPPLGMPPIPYLVRRRRRRGIKNASRLTYLAAAYARMVDSASKRLPIDGLHQRPKAMWFASEDRGRHSSQKFAETRRPGSPRPSVMRPVGNPNGRTAYSPKIYSPRLSAHGCPDAEVCDVTEDDGAFIHFVEDGPWNTCDYIDCRRSVSELRSQGAQRKMGEKAGNGSGVCCGRDWKPKPKQIDEIIREMEEMWGEDYRPLWRRRKHTDEIKGFFCLRTPSTPTLPSSYNGLNLRGGSICCCDFGN